jgi:hypothetical protein
METPRSETQRDADRGRNESGRTRGRYPSKSLTNQTVVSHSDWRPFLLSLQLALEKKSLCEPA